MVIDFRKPHWLLLVVLCVGAALYSWFYFSSAFPILNVDVSMDRSAALQRASDRAERLDLGPDNLERAASFSHDGDVQTFVELEAGGKDAFRRMIREDHYQPFQWQVRLYEPGETREATVRFTPDGRLYGFSETWPESDTGPALSSEEALSIAESRATEDWNVDLGSYELISRGQQEVSSGRVDHTFTYEHESRSIGEGDYRLRLGVSGDRLSEVTYYVRVPEAFQRRYENMRSANSLIQTSGNVVVYGLYLLVGCLFGAYWLVRRDALRWRMPLVWGGFITALMVLSRLNALPLAWMSYDTALAPGSFLAQQVVGALTSTLPFGLFITLSFVAAEGLNRLAFGHHPKLWRLWNPEAGGSRTVLSLTVFGYVFVGLYFAYNVALYSYAYEYLNWWSPSNLLYDPNVLSHYFPWLKPVTNALRAGFWEECLFRAVPLAGAALIGQRFGRKRWWIGFALVFQALVFGAGHASYATQPSYARVVELFFSSLTLGVIFLAYGLLPAVIIHFLYDLILMALPIFVSTAAGIWMSQSVVVVAGLIPLLVVFYGRFHNGKWIDLPDRFYNHAWSPGTGGSDEDSRFPVPFGLSVQRTILCVLAGLVGLGLWWGLGNFETRETPLSLTRSEAEGEARDLLRERGANPDEWTVASRVAAPKGTDDAFVLQEGGTEAYDGLMGSYLEGPYWTVRFMTFEGSQVDRAEEYRAHVAPNSGRFQLQHRLPESAPGDRLPETRARAVADSAVLGQFDYDREELELISAEPTSRPNRRDWTFTYRVPGDYPMEDGEARVRVNLGGAEVTGTSRYVHVPESWERDRRSRRTLLDLLGNTANTLLVLLVFAGAVAGIFYWGREGTFSRRAALAVFGGYLLLMIAGVASNWPVTVFGFDTAEPYLNQVYTEILGQFPRLIQGGILALVAGYVHARLGRNDSVPRTRSLAVGSGLGLLGVGVLTLAGYFGPQLTPSWGDYGTLSRAVPVLHLTIASLGQLLKGSLVLLLFAVVQHRWTRAGRSRSLLTLGLFFGCGVLVGSVLPVEHLTEWMVRAGLLGIVFLFAGLLVLPHDRSFVPLAMAIVVVTGLVKSSVTSAHPYALSGPVLAAVVTLAVGVLWTFWLRALQDRSS